MATPETDTAVTAQGVDEHLDPGAIMARAIADQRRAEQQAVMDLVLAAQPRPEMLTTTAELALREPFVLPGEPDLRIDMVKVTVTRTLGEAAAADDEDGRSLVEVSGWATPLRADGRPNQNTRPSWHPLPSELGPLLFGLAATH